MIEIKKISQLNNQPPHALASHHIDLNGMHNLHSMWYAKMWRHSIVSGELPSGWDNALPVSVPSISCLFNDQLSD